MHSIRRIFLSAVVFAFLAVSLVARAQGPLRFVPVSPCRIVDTRWSNGPFGMARQFKASLPATSRSQTAPATFPIQRRPFR